MTRDKRRWAYSVAALAVLVIVGSTASLLIPAWASVGT